MKGTILYENCRNISCKSTWMHFQDIGFYVWKKKTFHFIPKTYSCNTPHWLASIFHTVAKSMMKFFVSIGNHLDDAYIIIFECQHNFLFIERITFQTLSFISCIRWSGSFHKVKWNDCASHLECYTNSFKCSKR